MEKLLVFGSADEETFFIIDEDLSRLIETQNFLLLLGNTKNEIIFEHVNKIFKSNGIYLGYDIYRYLMH